MLFEDYRALGLLDPETKFIGRLSERVLEAVRISVRQPRIYESLVENLQGRRGIAPKLARQPNDLEPLIRAVDLRCRKQRIVQKPILSKEVQPIEHDSSDIVADKEKAGCESFAALRIHLPHLGRFYRQPNDML